MADREVGPQRPACEESDRDDRGPVQRTIELVAGRWTLAVLIELYRGGRRYGDLDAVLDGVSHKLLTDTLRRADRGALIIRHVDSGRVDTVALHAPKLPVRRGREWLVHHLMMGRLRGHLHTVHKPILGTAGSRARDSSSYSLDDGPSPCSPNG